MADMRKTRFTWGDMSLPLPRDGSRIRLNHHKSRPAKAGSSGRHHQSKTITKTLSQSNARAPRSRLDQTMSPYQHLFSANAVLGVWRNLRSHRDQNDLLLTFQYQPDDVRTQKARRSEKSHATEASQEVLDGKTVDAGGKSIGFVVPWRSMQAQRKELREKEKELAEALVVLTGEVAFTGMGIPDMRSPAHDMIVGYKLTTP